VSGKITSKNTAGKSLIQDKFFMEKIERLEFHISYVCNNDCIFCSENDRLKKFNTVKFLPKVLVKNILKDKLNKGYHHVNFTGGEPTIHPDFLEIIRYAKKIGYRIYVGTNGCRFNDKNFMKNFLPYIDEISFSLHGANAKLHKALTKSSNFLAIENGLRLSKKINPQIEVFVNTVAIKKNVNFIGSLLEYLNSFKIDQVLISSLAPEGRGLKSYAKLAVTFEQWQKTLKVIGEQIDQYNFKVRFFGLPFCLLGEQQAKSNDLYWNPRTTVEVSVFDNGKIKLDSIDDYKPLRNRKKINKCHGCGHSNLCGGIFEHYCKIFGEPKI
jgi:MoaA/NifB/PqqE/SkfB family radical SAM enzyme